MNGDSKKALSIVYYKFTFVYLIWFLCQNKK